MKGHEEAGVLTASKEEAATVPQHHVPTPTLSSEKTCFRNVQPETPKHCHFW